MANSIQTVVAVVDGAGSGEVEAFKARVGQDVVVIADKAGTVSSRFGIEVWPTTLSVDGAGVISDVVLGGQVSHQDFVSALANQVRRQSQSTAGEPCDLERMSTAARAIRLGYQMGPTSPGWKVRDRGRGGTLSSWVLAFFLSQHFCVWRGVVNRFCPTSSPAPSWLQQLIWETRHRGYWRDQKSAAGSGLEAISRLIELVARRLTPLEGKAIPWITTEEPLWRVDRVLSEVIVLNANSRPTDAGKLIVCSLVRNCRRLSGTSGGAERQHH